MERMWPDVSNIRPHRMESTCRRAASHAPYWNMLSCGKTCLAVVRDGQSPRIEVRQIEPVAAVSMGGMGQDVARPSGAPASPITSLYVLGIPTVAGFLAQDHPPGRAGILALYDQRTGSAAVRFAPRSRVRSIHSWPPAYRPPFDNVLGVLADAFRRELAQPDDLGLVKCGSRRSWSGRWSCGHYHQASLTGVWMWLDTSMDMGMAEFLPTLAMHVGRSALYPGLSTHRARDFRALSPLVVALVTPTGLEPVFQP